MSDHDQYGEHLYWITIMGEPSGTQPWGWQFEGHHLIINFFVLGDQVVMTPTFVGGEPVLAESGKYEGTSILQSEQAMGLALINALTPMQRSEAIIDPNRPATTTMVSSSRTTRSYRWKACRSPISKASSAASR